MKLAVIQIQRKRENRQEAQRDDQDSQKPIMSAPPPHASELPDRQQQLHAEVGR